MINVKDFTTSMEWSDGYVLADQISMQITLTQKVVQFSNVMHATSHNHNPQMSLILDIKVKFERNQRELTCTKDAVYPFDCSICSVSTKFAT